MPTAGTPTPVSTHALGPPPGDVPDLFFRPPLGQVLITDKAPPYGATYHYARRSGENTVVTDVYVTLSTGRPTGIGSAGTEKTLRPPGRDPLLFRQSEFAGVGEDDGSYSRWVLQGLGTTQVTLLYRCEKGRLPEAAAQIEKSARSLALGDDIAASRRAYARWEKGPARAMSGAASGVNYRRRHGPRTGEPS